MSSGNPSPPDFGAWADRDILVWLASQQGHAIEDRRNIHERIDDVKIRLVRLEEWRWKVVGLVGGASAVGGFGGGVLILRILGWQ